MSKTHVQKSLVSAIPKLRSLVLCVRPKYSGVCVQGWPKTKIGFLWFQGFLCSVYVSEGLSLDPRGSRVGVMGFQGIQCVCVRDGQSLRSYDSGVISQGSGHIVPGVSRASTVKGR